MAVERTSAPRKSSTVVAELNASGMTASRPSCVSTASGAMRAYLLSLARPEGDESRPGDLPARHIQPITRGSSKA